MSGFGEYTEDVMEGKMIVNEARRKLGLPYVRNAQVVSREEGLKRKLEYLDHLEVLRRGSVIASKRESIEDRIERVLDSVEDDLGLKPNEVNVGNLTVNITASVTPEFEDTMLSVSEFVTELASLETQATQINVTINEEGVSRGNVSNEEDGNQGSTVHTDN